MNILFPVVYVPEDLTWINSFYLNNSRKSYVSISENVNSKPFLKLHVDRLFSQYIKANSIESMLNALGWRGFRDRLASSYLYHFFHGFFPQEDELDNITEVIQFEDDLKGIFPEGNSRIFFLGFFLKMCEIQSMKDNSDNFISFLKLSRELKQVLLLGDQKIVKPDWMILSLIHFESFLGRENILEIIKEDKGDFSLLRKRLSSEQKELMIQNFLRYGASINEQEMFIYEKVV
jgi:hypothetical protein